jgi:uncharacterized protein (TIGR01627 family)
MKTDTYTPMHGGRRMPNLTCVGVVLVAGVLGEVVWLLAQGRCPGCVWRDDRVLLPDPRMQQSLGQVSITVGEVERVRRAAGQCALLVFGVGFDSGFWMQVNGGGRTEFLEDDAAWAQRVRAHVPNISVHLVQYHTKMGRDDERYVDPRTWHALDMALPWEVRATAWDVVIVDGPAGYAAGTPGRIQSLYAAATLRRPPNALTVVDDCDRRVEGRYADLFFGRAALVQKVARELRVVPSLWNPVYSSNYQCFYRGGGPAAAEAAGV